MGWFKQQHWIIISAAAVCVSCQELTSTLRNGSHACRGEEVLFTCTVRGSAVVPDLILAWNSTEYIGQGNPLRFTTEDIPGMTRTSMINGNVTATLTSNTNITGVSVLVSELRIVADRSSTVTCTSVTTSNTNSTALNVSDVPEAPLNVGATEILRLPENGCEILVKWDHPANSLDIDHYIVYVPPPNMNCNKTNTSLLSTLRLRDCPGSFGIKVAAVNRFDCIGINSSEAYVTVQPESRKLGPGAIAGIVISAVIISCFLVIVALIIICSHNCCYIVQNIGSSLYHGIIRCPIVGTTESTTDQCATPLQPRSVQDSVSEDSEEEMVTDHDQSDPAVCPKDDFSGEDFPAEISSSRQMDFVESEPNRSLEQSN